MSIKSPHWICRGRNKPSRPTLHPSPNRNLKHSQRLSSRLDNLSHPTQPTFPPQELSLITATVTRVVDGDTAHISIAGKDETVRFIGVDTPETVHPTRGEEPYGREASDFTKAQLTGKTVLLETDAQERDKYGRLLAYVSQQLFLLQCSDSPKNTRP